MNYSDDKVIGRVMNVHLYGSNNLEQVFCIGRNKNNQLLGLIIRPKCCGIDKRNKFKLGRKNKYVALLNTLVYFECNRIVDGEITYIGKNKAHEARRQLNERKRKKTG